ncbi:hypothetical protein Syun_030662 [Stephania yunnanensis]|uniref:Uncharacterized protein n=1 Tax=Stephania yunnanensis TaxID=152371 RepID=A0AAP0HC35_9MAGN
MILDIVTAFRNRKTWVPSRFFSLNSVTLTLLSVVAKVPVDLTTTMPSVEDQLSKLTSTTLVCISMGFFLPSLGNNSESECSSNVAALSILVVTIFVNVCIQLHTKVIILFREIHIVILCLMMGLLMIFWFYAFDINGQKQYSLDYMKRDFANGKKSMLHRLKASYLYGHAANPQFVICRHAVNASACIICAICSYLLFGSLIDKKLGFCEKISDYKWSIKIVVISQIITIAVGTFGTTFRLLSMFSFVNLDRLQILPSQVIDADVVMAGNPLIRRTVRGHCIFIVKALTMVCIALIELWIKLGLILIVAVISWLFNLFRRNDKDYKVVEEFKDFVSVGAMDLNEWTLAKGMKDMKRLMEHANQTKASSNHHLFKLLSRTTPSISQEGSTLNLLKKRYERSWSGEISCLSILLLVRIATVSIPFSLSGSLLKSLNEVFEIIHFVDRRIRPSNPKNKMISRLAKAMWIGRNFDVLLPKIFVKSTNNEALPEPKSQLDQAVVIIGGLKKALAKAEHVRDELGIITDFIVKHRVYGSIEELYEFMEQLFVDMLNEFLIQLPNAIYKDVIESNPEEFEGRVKFALECLLKVEQLEGLVQWSFPIETTFTGLIVDEAPQVLQMRDMPPRSLVNTTDAPHSTTINDSGDNHVVVPIASEEEIIEIEEVG